MLGEASNMKAGFNEEVKNQWKPNWTNLATFKIWRDAISQVVFMSGIGFGPVLYMSNCVNSATPIRGTYGALIVGTLISLLATAVSCMYLGTYPTA